MIDTFRARRYKVIKEHLDWVEIEYKKINGYDRWYIKWTNKKVVSLVPKKSRHLEFIYRLFKVYKTKYWDVFTFDKNKNFYSSWQKRIKPRVYLVDKNEKVLVKFNSFKALSNVILKWGEELEVYSKMKKEYCPRMKYAVEEDYYGSQYKFLVD